MAEIAAAPGRVNAVETARTGYLRVGADMDLRKVTTPILLHMLRNEFRFPFLFMLRCKLTVGSFKRTIDPRFPQDLIDLAALPLWVYINMKKRIGEKKAFEIMRVAILTGGLASWNFNYKAAERERNFKNLCDAEIEVNKTGFTKWNTMEVVERTERRFEIKITRCLYHELTTSVGVPELTPVICQVDNAAFNSYLPDKIVFNRGGPGHRIADGAKECKFVWDLRE
ncbi:MAG TPA: L-2-amino-thiazoline-4-carboxylic acid hydrolase [Stellaceae bacterium]|nr:L-2-amino-thiazoline-4-carboxylic acid hydrolase [Stellaceae bacterium]